MTEDKQQPDLLTYAEAEARRDRALESVEANAGRWVDEAVAFIEAYARRNPTVFVDDLWEAGLPRPPEPKALGPAILKAARAGIIAKSGQYRPSRSSNMLPKPVWASKLWLDSLEARELDHYDPKETPCP